jgi:hypothetical protein
MTDWHEAGCTHDCREQHTYTLGRCAHSTDQPAEPVTLVGRVETMTDGQPGIVMHPVTGLHARLAAAIRDTPARYPDDIATAVLAALLGPIPDDSDTSTWTTVRAIQLMNEAGRQRDTARALLADVLAQFDGIRNSDGLGDIQHWQARVTPGEYEHWQEARAAGRPTATQATDGTT